MKMFSVLNKTLNISCSNSACNSGFGPGVRTEYILHYVISGSGYFKSCGITHEVKKGQSFLIMPNTVIEYYPSKSNPWEYVWVNFSGDMAKLLLSQTAFSKYESVAPSFGNELFQKYNRIKVGFNADTTEGCCAAYAALYEIFGFYAEHMPQLINAGTSDEYGIEPILKYITLNIHRPELSVESVARDFGMDRVTLYRAFKKHTGSTPHEYIRKRQLHTADRLLRMSNISVKAVAGSVGFTDQMYFSKVFKKEYGKTPQEFRKLYRN